MYHFHPGGLAGCFAVERFVTYRIYQSTGQIERIIPAGLEQRDMKDARYVYVAADGCEHDFGQFVGNQATRWVRKGQQGTETICLMAVEPLASNPARKFGFRFAGTNRKYLNQSALASLIGALMEVGYEDVVSTGFSMKDGSPGVSKSHINGENGDFLFQRIDKSGVDTDLRDSRHVPLFDEARQASLNEAFYKFGWKTQYAWTYKKDGQRRTPPRTVHLKGHHNHLHVEGYRPLLKEIQL